MASPLPATQVLGGRPAVASAEGQAVSIDIDGIRSGNRDVGSFRWGSRVSAASRRGLGLALFYVVLLSVFAFALSPPLAAASGYHRQPKHNHTYVHRVLKKSTVILSPKSVRLLRGNPASGQTLTLAPGARPPRLGAALVLPPSAKAPDGVLGVVISRRKLGRSWKLALKPGTLDSAYSSFHAHLDAPLGEAVAAPESASSSSAFGHFAPSFTCHGPALGHPITTHVDLSEMHLTLDLTTQPSIDFLLSGTPRFQLGVAFTGTATCTARALIPIPVADTGIVLGIGPQFTFSAHGEVGANFSWAPRMTFGYFRSRSSGNTDTHVFNNAGSAVAFSGGAGVDLYLALETDITLAGRVGVSGTIGPDLSGSLQADSAGHGTCFGVNASVKAQLSAFADVLFSSWNFQIFSGSFGSVPIYRRCGNDLGELSDGSGAGGGGSGAGGGGVGAEGGEAPPGAQLAVGNGTACAIVTGGAVRCWGSNQVGSLGNGTISTELPASGTPLSVAGISGAVALAGGGEFDGWGGFCALLSSGHAECWGFPYGDAPAPVTGLSGARAIAVGGAHACAIVSAGGVECWGYNYSGQLGDGSTESSQTPVAVQGISEALVIAAGESHTCVVLAGGGVKCWGDDYNGLNSPTPVAVAGISDATAISADRGSTCAVLADRSTKCWGSLQGQDISNLSGAVAVAMGANHSCAILLGGEVECEGENPLGQLGAASLGLSDSIAMVSGIDDALQIAASAYTTCVLEESAQIRCWGAGNYGELGNGVIGETTSPTTVLGIADATTMSSGVGYRCAIVEGGQVDCWGANTLGQLGNGTLGVDSADPTPAPVPGLSGASAVAAGANHTCAVVTAGHVDCWGDNRDGQLGAGSSGTNHPEPIEVQELSGATAVAVGQNHSCAIVAEGRVRCWGQGAYGQLGDGEDTPISLAPVSASGLTGASAIAAGETVTCAISAGSLFCWGYQYGSTPTPVEGISGARAVAIDTATICVALQTGAVDCWGNYTGSTTPKAVAGVSGALTVDTEAGRFCSVTSSAQVLCWGERNTNELDTRLGTFSPEDPHLIPGLSGALQASGGRDFTCALLASGQIKCLGYNYRGERGNGQIGLSPTPVAVLGIP